MPCPASALAPPRRRRRRALREGGGLAFACPARQVEFVLQPVFSRRSRWRSRSSQSRSCSNRARSRFVRSRRRNRSICLKLTDGVGAIRHIEVMPDSAHCTSQECSVWRVRPGNQLRCEPERKQCGPLKTSAWRPKKFDSIRRAAPIQPVITIACPSFPGLRQAENSKASPDLHGRTAVPVGARVDGFIFLERADIQNARLRVESHGLRLSQNLLRPLLCVPSSR